MREGEEVAIDAAKKAGYIPQETTAFTGSDFHYNMFESMISGRNMHDENLKPNENFRKIFKA